MHGMFLSAVSFNQFIGNWNTSNVRDMSHMFNNAASFNQDISNWNTSSVTNMNFMFVSARDFNQFIGLWDTGNVTSMSMMFASTTNFNNGAQRATANFNIRMFWNFRSLGGTGNQFMFQNATGFNTDISNWNIPVDRLNNGGYGFRRNNGMLENFVPPNIRNFAPSRGL